MSRTRTRRFYTPEQKAEALRHLRQNFGDITATSQQLRIPARTLRAWRQEYQAYTASSAAAEPVDPPPTTVYLPADAAEAADEFEKLRASLMTQVMQLTSEQNAENVATRAAALSRLLTWVFKLDEVIPMMRPEQVLRIEYKNPDGTISDRPYWMNERDDDDNTLPVRKTPWNRHFPELWTTEE